MINLALLSRELWLPGINRRAIDSEVGIREWISGGQWTFAELLRKNKAKITAHVFDEYAQASLVDAITLSIAASESASAYSRPVAGIDDRSCAWRLISVYYAAYFAANALMRICGYACTNISALECASVNEMAILTGFKGAADNHKLTQGIYFIRPVSIPDGVVSVDMLNGGGGVHIQFWIGFKRFLEDLRISINASDRLKHEKKSAQSELTSLIDGLTYANSANGSWLSEVRNSINYRFEFGSWYPYSKSRANGSEIEAILRDSVRNGRVAIPPPGALVPEVLRATHISAALLFWLSEWLRIVDAGSSGRKKSLLSNGALGMLKTI